MHCTILHLNIFPDGGCCMCLVVCRNQSFLVQVFFTWALLEHLVCGQLSPEAAEAGSARPSPGRAAGRLWPGQAV